MHRKIVALTALATLMFGSVVIERAAAQFPSAAFSINSFQHDLFTGGAAAQIPIEVPAGAAGTAPKIVLRYGSTIVDDLKPTDQGQETGLGWTLDVGGFVLRDMKGTASPGDDGFRLVFAGASHELVLVDSGQNLYRTKDETFLRIQYVPASDYWIVTTKDGTRHRFGFSPATRANALREDGVTALPYKYLLDEVTTTSGTAIQYTYFKATTTFWNGSPYDQFVYPDTITWTYHNGNLVGPAREVRFKREARTDWSGDSGETAAMYFFSRDRIETIEVWVGADLVRSYTLAYDYSIDRDPAYTWDGGATGDLTLTGITLTGADGGLTLPPVTFTYTAGGRLATVTNGSGGTVTYQYERVTPYVPLYQRYRIEEWGENGLT